MTKSSWRSLYNVRRMLDSHYRPIASINTDFMLARNAFYANFLRH